jgi:hypothetical protein
VPGYSSGRAPEETERAVDDLDPEDFALRVRQLAVKAHRLLRNPATSYRERVELSGQIDDLRHQRGTRGLPEREIDRWLRNASTQVRDHRASLSTTA